MTGVLLFGVAAQPRGDACVLPQNAFLCVPCGHMAKHLLDQGQSSPKVSPTTGVGKAFYSLCFSGPQQQMTCPSTYAIASDYSEEHQTPQHKDAAASLSLAQLLIPANGQSLYTTIIVGDLLPVRQQAAKVSARIAQAFCSSACLLSQAI